MELPKWTYQRTVEPKISRAVERHRRGWAAIKVAVYGTLVGLIVLAVVLFIALSLWVNLTQRS